MATSLINILKAALGQNLKTITIRFMIERRVTFPLTAAIVAERRKGLNNIRKTNMSFFNDCLSL